LTIASSIPPSMTLGSSALGLTVATASGHLCMRKGQLQHCDPSHYYWVSNTLGFNGNPPRAGALSLSGGHTTSDCTERHTLHSSTVCTTVPSLVTPAYAGNHSAARDLLQLWPAPSPARTASTSTTRWERWKHGTLVTPAGAMRLRCGFRPVSSRRSTLAALLLAPCASCKLNLGWLSERRN
jgi:hypothetical protein